jgi:hypothetical protein
MAGHFAGQVRRRRRKEVVWKSSRERRVAREREVRELELDRRKRQTWSVQVLGIAILSAYPRVLCLSTTSLFRYPPDQHPITMTE